MEIFDLKVTERKGTGKGHAHMLRSQGFVPAVLYGPKTETVSLSVPAMEISRIFKQNKSEHVILNLIIENGGTRQKTAMIKELQVYPTTHEYLHVDFYEIAMDRKLVVKVPVEVAGKSEGVERGGTVQLIRHQLEVSCLPADIPAKIVVDISKLDIGESIHVEEIVVGDNVELVYDVNFTVVAIAAPAVEKVAVSEEEVAGAEEGEAEQPTEPAAE